MLSAILRVIKVEAVAVESVAEVVKRPVYRKSGYVYGEIGTVIGLIIGVGVATMVIIFIGILGGQTYQMTEADIQAINDTTIKGYITDSITNSFKALSQTGKYLPLVVLAVIISIVLAVIIGLGRGGGGYYYYGAL